MSLTTDVVELLEALGPFYEYVKEEDSGVEMESGAMSALLGKFAGPLTKIKYQEVIGQHFLSKYLFFFGPIGSTSFPSIFQSALLQFSIYLYAPGTFYRQLYAPSTYLLVPIRTRYLLLPICTRYLPIRYRGLHPRHLESWVFCLNN